MQLLGTKNVARQELLVNGLVNLGAAYRRYNKKDSCCVSTFSNTSSAIVLQRTGIYHVTVQAVGTAPAAGNVTLQLLENGTPVTGALSTQTITTPNTEVRTFVIDYYILVDSSCVLGNNTAISKSIAVQNTGVASALTSVVVNIDKVV